ncbi:MAG TPA: 1,2-phenylacetyl-CoA epoxidase subunit PaaE [Bryobacteraceae bacterium]|jgi:ring-1,2-phenylacetyl-CoA epoxidase subunit PaaE|nr:1,2-phenylacetyl-CoA epoxidase subunit PaaE [Bryobacteraceae bacterium]
MPSKSTEGFYRLKVCSVRQDTRDSVIVNFEVPPELQEKFRFVQGQFVTLRAWIGGQDVRRSYSICSAVQDGLLRVGVKRTPGGVFSNWIIDQLKPGCEVEVMPPEGRFHVTLCPSNAKNYVAFAAGSGITPIFSLIKTTLLTEPKSTFTLFYGNRASSTIMLREELADLKDQFLDRFSLIHVMTREQQDVDLLNGRITDEKAKLLLESFCWFDPIDTVFLCGPQQMTDDVSQTLKRMGFADSQIKIELFTVEGSQRSAPKATVKEAEAQCQVTIRVDGAEHAFAMPKGNEPILRAALSRGIDLRHSCQSGVCGTCRAKLISGKVDMDATYALEEYEIARGLILTCQSYPVTDEVMIDFDQDS